MVEETSHCQGGLTLNICLSYGSRGEIVNACRSVSADVLSGALDLQDINEVTFQKRLLTSHSPDPDIIIRTSGEYRVSNFLLWQLAYSEMFFCPKTWPEFEKEDLLQVIRTYAKGRCRRFGK
jgi:undecaprenyl diphosphate synthase